MAGKRKGRKEKKSRGIKIVTIPIICVLTAVLIIGNIACMVFSKVLDVYIGTGEATVSVKPGSENWDTSYYTPNMATAEEVDAYAKDTTRRIASEGIVLLKNEDSALPMSECAVSLFGRRSVDTVFGGTGSGAGDYNQCITLANAMRDAGFSVNGKLLDMYASNMANVPVAENSMDKIAEATYYIGEFPQSCYGDDITATYSSYGDAAIVVFGRQGGEGMDFATDMKATLGGSTAMTLSASETANYADGQHQLELSKEEKDLLRHVESNFDKVIVVINSANVMEIGCLRDDPKVDAVLWIAYPGSMGMKALADILKGDVNPSGHTVDTWPVDMTQDPTFPNTSPRKYVNVSAENALKDSYVLEYEEGIYSGYRYYETVDADGGTFTVKGESGKSYEEAVAYPFGYGLSYTTFNQAIKEVRDENGVISVTVTVNNTGNVAGKDVVQVYYHAPYTPGGIEKAASILAGYTKTKELAPGEKADYTVIFREEDMASYDYKQEKCYVLENGDYVITVNRDAHNVYGENCTYTHNVPKTIVYGQGNPRETEKEAQTGEYVNLSEKTKKHIDVKAATNKFDDVSAHFVPYKEAKGGYGTEFTRAAFAESFPTAPTEEDLTASDSTIVNLGAYTPDYYSADDKAPATGEKNNITVVALRGAAYDDPRWDLLLDQLTGKQMSTFIYQGNQGTTKLASVGLPGSKATDGPAGLKQYGGLGFGTSGNFNCSSTLTAATWNVELAKEFGISVGNEALLAKISGWYAPGCDIHRSPFGGRNFEYYSEDPLISGSTCAATIEGAASQGLVCYAKHFVLNDMDSHRIDNGFVTWANEQAIREVYLKAYEIAVKTPLMDIKYLDEEGNTCHKTTRAMTGIMTSFNRIGDTWCGGSSPLLQGVLRGEWGFIGTVITDYNSHEYMNVELGVVSGNDLMLANQVTLPTKFADVKNPATLKIMREACKNVFYTLANSSTVNGTSDTTLVTYAISPWKIWLMEIDGGVLAVIAALVTLTVHASRKHKNLEILND